MEGKEVNNEDDKEMGICKTKRWATRRVWVGGGHNEEKGVGSKDGRR